MYSDEPKMIRAKQNNVKLKNAQIPEICTALVFVYKANLQQLPYSDLEKRMDNTLNNGIKHNPVFESAIFLVLQAARIAYLDK